MKNEKEILEICKKERKIILKKQWLVTLFFVAAAVVIGIICCKALSAPVGDYGEAAGLAILITLSIFASLIISGFFYYKNLSKKLDKLWEQKKLLF